MADQAIPVGEKWRRLTIDGNRSRNMGFGKKRRIMHNATAQVAGNRRIEGAGVFAIA